MEPISVFDIFKIGVGPSSSHTMGPWRACRQCLSELQAVGNLDRVLDVQVRLYGSLAKTGAGHGTDKAVLLGLMGEDPAKVDVGTIAEKTDEVKRSKQIKLLGVRSVAFEPDEDIIFLRNETLPFHANALEVNVRLKGSGWQGETYYSVGGGFVVKEGEEAAPQASASVPFSCTTGAELLTHCSEAGLSISELVRENEKVWRDTAAIDAQLRRIWSTMKTCVYRGCHAEGELPGGLQVQRRASKLNRKLLGGQRDPAPRAYTDTDAWVQAIRSKKCDFQAVLKWVSCFALATNEENAAFGRVVTAPTNGAAGVIPAVLLHYICFCNGKEENVPKFLLAAGQIGSLFKQKATISAAMGGCQAEIGVSSAMASAGLAECLGGSVEQVLMVAEIAMEHHLGLTCDPVGGLVQIPCIERNSMGAVKAITACNVALESDPSRAKVSLDAVTKSMWETAQDMNSKYKETSEGGLAVNIPVNVSEC